MVHPDIREFFEYSLVKHQREGGKIHIKAYALKEFVAMTLKKENFKDMEVHTRKILASFDSKSSKVWMWEKQIDQLACPPKPRHRRVYKLYALTPEEIKIVEGK